MKLFGFEFTTKEVKDVFFLLGNGLKWFLLIIICILYPFTHWIYNIAVKKTKNALKKFPEQLNLCIGLNKTGHTIYYEEKYNDFLRDYNFFVKSINPQYMFSFDRSAWHLKQVPYDYIADFKAWADGYKEFKFWVEREYSFCYYYRSILKIR